VRQLRAETEVRLHQEPVGGCWRRSVHLMPTEAASSDAAGLKQRDRAQREHCARTWTTPRSSTEGPPVPSVGELAAGLPAVAGTARAEDAARHAFVLRGCLVLLCLPACLPACLWLACL
jgi:hypothetical protein